MRRFPRRLRGRMKRDEGKTSRSALTREGRLKAMAGCLSAAGRRWRDDDRYLHLIIWSGAWLPIDDGEFAGDLTGAENGQNSLVSTRRG